MSKDTDPDERDLLRITVQRSLIDWRDDGNPTDYGWKVMLYLRGKHRARWSTRKGTTRTWPRISRGGDENCNRAITLLLWPLGHLDVWWEPNWRTDVDGMCAECIEEMAS